MQDRPEDPGQIATTDDRLLIYAPVPVFRQGTELFIEHQAVTGLRLWGENFSQVACVMPAIDQPPPEGWDPYQPGSIARVTLHTVPAAYTSVPFLRALPGVRRQFAALIDQADYMSFGIGGLVGDWGAVASFVAHRKGRAFAVWTDRVESQVTRLTAADEPFKRRLKYRLTAGPMWALEKAVIRRAPLGLFHGAETFATYAPYSRNPQIVHDILLDRSTQIDDADFAAKQEATDGAAPLNIVYAGRADAMKGPLDWLDALAVLKADGAVFQARWLGDGEMLSETRAKAAALGLDEVAFPGFINDRMDVMKALREAHVFVFCHKTPESPRCLIEALMSGTPIVGYDGAYARDLVAAHGGGAFVPLGDSRALGTALAGLARDRAGLAALQRQARQDGAQFDQDSVFRHRSEIIKRELGAGAQGGS